MKSLGGYLELELNDNNTLLHESAKKLNSGRNALEFILRQNDYDKIYLPVYSCNVVLQPIIKLGIAYEYYHINEKLLPVIKNINNNDVIIYINYFGVMDDSIEELKNNYSNLIVDNSQAFYAFPLKNIPTFYSPRKFFGLPDGGIAYVNVKNDLLLEKDVSFSRVSHLIKRLDLDAESGYLDFQENDKALDNLPIKVMSNFTQRILQSIDFESVKSIRVDNFYRLHKKLHKFNLLSEVIENHSFQVPMVYPFLRKNNTKLRNHLNKHKIYNATYWPNVEELVTNKDYEYFLVNNLIALPIDQRLNCNDIDRIINEVTIFING